MPGKSEIFAIFSNLRVYFVVRLPDYEHHDRQDGIDGDQQRRYSVWHRTTLGNAQTGWEIHVPRD